MQISLWKRLCECCILAPSGHHQKLHSPILLKMHLRAQSSTQVIKWWSDRCGDSLPLQKGARHSRYNSAKRKVPSWNQLSIQFSKWTDRMKRRRPRTLGRQQKLCCARQCHPIKVARWQNLIPPSFSLDCARVEGRGGIKFCRVA